jgi:branched-chain amino acid transport system ATP-binding protein
LAAVLEIRDLSVFYGNIQALRGINMDVGQGEIVALIGNNGAGKSTTLRAISGIVKAASGSITFNGARIDRLPSHLVTRAGISHVLEGRQVFANLTVRENLLIGAYLNPDRSAVQASCQRMFQLFPALRDRQGQYAGTLSGGEQQMLAMARGLMSAPQMLLLDEPSLGLAPVLVKQVASIIDTIGREGIPILLVEQNARLALSLANRGYVLESGEITLEGDSVSLRDNEMVKKAYLGV